MRRLPVTISIFTILFFIFSLTGNILIADSSFSSIALADDKKVVKKKIKKKVTINKTDGKITIKKKINIKKVVKKKGGKGNNGVPKQIRNLQAGLASLQTQVDTIELTPGPQGEQGPTGADGATGATGPQGEEGIPGSNGSDGNDGAQGPQGSEGPQGPAGNDGADGVAGADGAPGAVGAQGPQGEQGSQGEQGVQGEVGLQGPPGVEGPQGIQGPVGNDGEQGPQGIQGPEGPAGPAGNDGTNGVAGTQGIKGEQGDTGATGPQGEQGIQGEKGDTGLAGAKGDTGAPGTNGTNGIDGAPGLAGADGQDVDPTILNTLQTDVVELQDFVGGIHSSSISSQASAAQSTANQAISDAASAQETANTALAASEGIDPAILNTLQTDVVELQDFVGGIHSSSISSQASAAQSTANQAISDAASAQETANTALAASEDDKADGVYVIRSFYYSRQDPDNTQFASITLRGVNLNVGCVQNNCEESTVISEYFGQDLSPYINNSYTRSDLLVLQGDFGLPIGTTMIKITNSQGTSLYPVTVHQPTGHQIVRESWVWPNGGAGTNSVINKTITCPSGKVATGGGFRTPWNNTIYRSYPVSKDTWGFYFSHPWFSEIDQPSRAVAASVVCINEF